MLKRRCDALAPLGLQATPKEPTLGLPHAAVNNKVYKILSRTSPLPGT